MSNKEIRRVHLILINSFKQKLQFLKNSLSNAYGITSLCLWHGEHGISQHDCDSNNGDVSSGYDSKNIHTLSQCDDSSNFKQVYGDVKKGDVSSGYGSMNSHTDLQQNIWNHR